MRWSRRRRGIVHRDIKPQNVMLSATNHATVLDFGLATAAAVNDASRTATALTEAGAVIGTLSYPGRTPVRSGYEPITEFTDSATAPALSPDGRMVTFIRGGPWFLTSTGQIYVKMLPDGEAVKLTDDPRPKLGPVAAPADGSGPPPPS